LSIEVTVVGGYLGAGETTLLNELLRAATERIVVLVNDFGDINIDEELIGSRSEDTIELANGCICCSLVDGFAAALAEVSQLDPAPDRLVIEASGVADPAQVAAYGHSPGFHLGSVVVLVDAEQVHTQAEDRFVGTTVVRQIAGADLVVISKADLVDAGQIESVRRFVAELNHGALVVEASRGAVDADVLYGPTVERESRAAPAGHVHLAQHESWSLRWARVLERAELDALLDELPDGIVRAKGIVWCADPRLGERPWLVQAVGKRRSVVPWADRTDTSSRFVCIGHPGALDDEWLAARVG